MKKIILILLGLVIMGVAAGGYSLFQRGQVVSGGTEVLSERSKEYLENRPANDDTSLKFAAVTEEGENASEFDQTITADRCFHITLPFRISNSRQEDECFVHVSLRTPRGTLNAYRKYDPVASFDDISGIPMRRMNKDTYRESTKVIGGQAFLIFSKIEESNERSAFLLTPDGYMVINLLAAGGEELEEQFYEALGSLELL